MSRGFANVDSARLGTQNNVVITTSTVSVASSAFGSQTYQIRVATTTACNIKIGDGTPTATTSDALMPANWVDYFIVTPGQKIAAIGAVTTVSVTEITQ
jgi:hypothetical protein